MINYRHIGTDDMTYAYVVSCHNCKETMLDFGETLCEKCNADLTEVGYEEVDDPEIVNYLTSNYLDDIYYLTYTEPYDEIMNQIQDAGDSHSIAFVSNYGVSGEYDIETFDIAKVAKSARKTYAYSDFVEFYEETDNGSKTVGLFLIFYEFTPYGYIMRDYLGIIPLRLDENLNGEIDMDDHYNFDSVERIMVENIICRIKNDTNQLPGI